MKPRNENLLLLVVAGIFLALAAHIHAAAAECRAHNGKYLMGKCF